MIISERKGFIFIHNPKCAGTSVRAALMPFDTTLNHFWMFEKWNGTQVDKAHMPLTLFRRLYPEYYRLLDTYLSFMFVRDPYDRTVSAFNELRRGLLPSEQDLDSEKTYSAALNRFIGNMSEAAIRQEMHKYRHFVRQTDMAYIGHKRRVDVIMKMEDLPDALSQLAVFMPDIAETIGGGKKRNVKPLVREHRSYLDAKSIETINTIYASDFALFGYAKQAL
jgi:hypothetical protein